MYTLCHCEHSELFKTHAIIDNQLNKYSLSLETYS